MAKSHSYLSRLELMRHRVQALYVKAGHSEKRDPLLSAAFEELELAFDFLNDIETTAVQQRAHWLDERAELEIAYRHYYDLFVRAPVAYLVTNTTGKIKHANHACTLLLKVSEQQLFQSPLANFVPKGQRRALHSAIEAVVQAREPQEWQLQLQPDAGRLLNVTALVAQERDGRGRTVALLWLLKDTSQRVQTLNFPQDEATQQLHVL